MSEQTGFPFSRIGKLFKGGSKATGRACLKLNMDDSAGDRGGDSAGENGAPHSGPQHRWQPGLSSRRGHAQHFPSPLAKRDNAIVQLQEGFNGADRAHGAVKDSLDKQNQRQDDW